MFRAYRWQLVTERGPYRSREETQRRLLDAGIELARHRLPIDPFGHMRTNEVVADAGVSTSALYRAFGTVEAFHRALIERVVTDYWASHIEELDEGIIEFMKSGPTLAEVLRVVGAASFADLMADEFDNLQVAMSALHDDETMASLFLETDARTIVGMFGFYEHILEPIRFAPRFGVDLSDVAVLNFGIFDGMVMWNKVDSDQFLDHIDGPDGVEADGAWSPIGVAAWALGEHLLEAISADGR
jgi:AcrR family transcriptional regulator